MTVVGGSHTAFDTGSFTGGAVGGSLTIAGALAAGVVNYRAAQAQRWARWDEHALRSAIDYYEAQLERARDEIADLRQQLGTRSKQTLARQIIARRRMQAR